MRGLFGLPGIKDAANFKKANRFFTGARVAGQRIDQAWEQAGPQRGVIFAQWIAQPPDFASGNVILERALGDEGERARFVQSEPNQRMAQPCEPVVLLISLRARAKARETPARDFINAHHAG